MIAYVDRAAAVISILRRPVSRRWAARPPDGRRDDSGTAGGSGRVAAGGGSEGCGGRVEEEEGAATVGGRCDAEWSTIRNGTHERSERSLEERS